mgnify:CR=1 FL=1
MTNNNNTTLETIGQCVCIVVVVIGGLLGILIWC